MVAGLPGADRRAMVKTISITSPDLCAAYLKCYKDKEFEPNPSMENKAWGQESFTYETSLDKSDVEDIITIIDDLIDERL